MSGAMMDDDFELITKLRIAQAVLETKLESAQEALKLAHSNTLAWVMAGVGISSTIIILVMKFIH